MGIFDFFTKRSMTPPKIVRQALEKNRRYLEGGKLSDDAISHRNIGNFDKALSLLEMALVKFDYKPAITLIGTTLALQGNINGAIRWFEDQLDGRSEDIDDLKIEIYANLGSIYNNYIRDPQKALRMYEKALERPKPKSVDEEVYILMLSNIHHDLAIVYKNLGRPSLARKYAKKRLEVQPDCAKSVEILALTEQIAEDNGKSKI